MLIAISDQGYMQLKLPQHYLRFPTTTPNLNMIIVNKSTPMDTREAGPKCMYSCQMTTRPLNGMTSTYGNHATPWILKQIWEFKNISIINAQNINNTTVDYQKNRHLNSDIVFHLHQLLLNKDFTFQIIVVLTEWWFPNFMNNFYIFIRTDLPRYDKN